MPAFVRTLVGSGRFGLVLRLSLAALAIVFLLQTQRKAGRSYGYDFASYLASASALAEGADPYRTSHHFPYIYPLFLAFLLVPATHLPYPAAVVLWFVLSVACLWLAVRVTLRTLGRDPPGPAETNLALLAVLGFLDPIQIDLLNGQVNTQVLLLCMLVLEQYLRGRKQLAAVVLGAAVALKIVPLVLLAWVALRREALMIVVSLAAALVLCLTPFVLVGDAVFAHYAGYVRDFLLGHAVAAPMGGGRIYFTPYGLAGFLWPALRQAAWPRYVGAGLVAALLAWAGLRHRRKGSEPLLFCLGLVAIPLVSPMSEVHHLVFVLPAAIALTVAALRPDPALRTAAALFWCLLWAGRVDREGPFYFLSLVSLAAGLVLALRAAPEEAPHT